MLRWPVPIVRHRPMVGLLSYGLIMELSARRQWQLLQRIRAGCDVVMLDSGAFSARRKGWEVVLERYVAFATRAADHGLVDIVVNLDVGSKLDMRQNYVALRRSLAGRAFAMWVHQPSMGMEALVEAGCEHGYVGLGSYGMEVGSNAVERNHPDVVRYYEHCHELAEAHGFGMHGFAMTALPLVSAYPWATVDSSTWVGVQRYGFTQIPDLSDPAAPAVVIPKPYVARVRRTGKGNSIGTIPMDEASRIMRQFGVTLAEWGAMNVTEAAAVCGIAYVAVGDMLARTRPPAAWSGRLPVPALRDAGAVCVALVAIEVTMPALELVCEARKRAGGVHGGSSSSSGDGEAAGAQAAAVEDTRC